MAIKDDKPKPKVKPEPKSDVPPEDDDLDDADTDALIADAKKWRAMARKHEAENKRLKDEDADRQQKLDDADKANQTELEKVQTQLADLQGKLTAQEQTALRARVALRKGLSEAQAKRLAGDTEEELEADADDLLENFKPAGEERQPAPRKPGERPREALRPGSKPESEPLKPEDTDPIKLAEAVPR